MTNLSAGTYEVFENDTMKYIRYEQAIKAALIDIKTKGSFIKEIDYDGPISFEEQDIYFKDLEMRCENLLYQYSMKSKSNPNYNSLNKSNAHNQMLANNIADERTIQIMIVGAGRGPLIIRALNASRSSGVPVKITAVEKNIFAMIPLRSLLAQHDIEDQVVLVHGDMRELELNFKADIVVSELLGSFGDNELSPECLLPVQQYTHEGSIFIPNYYRSQVSPISSQVLWNEAKL